MGELRDRYHVGHNPPGYLADQAPACFEEWPAAANYLTVSMREYADADDEAAVSSAVQVAATLGVDELDWLAHSDYPRMRAHVDAILKDDPPREGLDYSAAVEDGDGRLIAFWLMKVLCLGEDEDTDLSTSDGPE